MLETSFKNLKAAMIFKGINKFVFNLYFVLYNEKKEENAKS